MANSEATEIKVTNEPGRLVWVCRLDGTWWLGQILSVDQITENNLSPSRAGTPVKLLGLENAIVEWYDVETSERIKSFRCREFDEYIEKFNAILQDLQLQHAQKSIDELQLELYSPSVSERRTLIDMNRSPDYNESLSLQNAIDCEKMKRLFEEPAIREHLPGSPSTYVSDGSQVVQVSCQENQVEAQFDDIEILDYDFTDNPIKSFSRYIGICDVGDDAPKNYGDRRSDSSTRRPYKLREKPRSSTKFAITRSASEKLKKTSSSIVFKHTNLSKRIPEFKNIKKPTQQCVPIKLIYSRLDEALR